MPRKRQRKASKYPPAQPTAFTCRHKPCCRLTFLSLDASISAQMRYGVRNSAVYVLSFLFRQPFRQDLSFASRGRQTAGEVQQKEYFLHRHSCRFSRAPRQAWGFLFTKKPGKSRLKTSATGFLFFFPFRQPVYKTQKRPDITVRSCIKIMKS